MSLPLSSPSPVINRDFHWFRPTILGILTVFIVGLLLNILGTGIGCALFSPTQGGLYPLSTKLVSWLLLVSVASMYAGGWMAGYFSKGTSSRTGIFYGSMISFTSIIILLVLTLSTLGTILSSSLTGLQTAFSLLGSTVTEGASAAGKLSKEIAKISPPLSEKVKDAVPNLGPIIEEINQKASELLPSQDQTNQDSDKNTNSSSSNNTKKLKKLMTSYFKSAEGSENKKEEMIQSFAEMSGKSQTEISQKMEEWQKLYTEAKEKARQAAIELSNNIAKMISELAFLNFFLLLSGIIAAIIGSVYGIKCRLKEFKAN